MKYGKSNMLAVVALLVLGIGGMFSRSGEPEWVAVEEAGLVVGAPVAASPTITDSWDASSAVVVGELAMEAPVVGGESGTPPAAVASAPSGYGAIARCGVSCWGQRLSRADVEALALSASGDAGWSEWAARCFTGGGENRGYVGAVGGPNRNGTFDLGLPQINTVHAGSHDLDRALVDPGYAVAVAYAIYLVQGRNAWYGCE